MEHIRMKEIPASERPCERCLTEGAQSLTDAELLAMIIRTGTKEDNSMTLAGKVLALNYPDEGILGLLHLSAEELMNVKGVGKVKAAQLLAIGELSKRIWRKETMRSLPAFQSPHEIADYYMEKLRHLEQEELHAMFFNTKQYLIRDYMISKGTVNASLASPREIMIEAMRCKAVNLILVHNHPSGVPMPSKDDLLFTRRVKDAGAIIGIQLIDHIVIGDNSYISMKEKGML